MSASPARFAGLLLALLPTLAMPVSAQGPGPTALDLEFLAKPTGRPLEMDLVVILRDKAGGAPVSGARIEINVDMPSMPMMHRVPKTVAAPAAEPGHYAARVKLEMGGEWAARILVTEPARLNTVRKFQAEGR